EGPPDVAVLDEAFAISQVEPGRQLHRCRPRRIRDRHDDIDFAQAQGPGDVVAEVFSHVQSGVIDGHPVHEAVRTGEVDVFEKAWGEARLFGALAAAHFAI